MNRLRKLLRLLWIAAALAPVASSSEEVAHRSARAVFFKRPAEFAESVVLVHDGGSIPISLPAMNLSEPVVLPVDQLVLAVLPQPPAPGKPIPPGAPLVKIPAGWSQVLLLFFHDPTNKVFPVRVLPFDGSTGSFKPGEMLCLNLSNAVVGGTLGEAKFRISPGKTAVLKPSIHVEGDYPVAVDCLLKGETIPRPLCRTTWRHDQKSRQILFIINAEDRPVPRIWSVTESLQIEE